MALIPKNDVTQIFAIQAPEVDLPPTFANYPRGWDTARSNNGKPTIKQFNFIQQRTDQNVLWIHQNGAALPYDATMEYAEGVVTLKDGRFKQWNGTTWINFGQDDSALKIASNLLDVPNKDTARTNLDVYSKAQTDANIAAAAITPDATETVAGKAKIATTAIAQAGVNDADIITAKKLRDALNADGDAPVYTSRAIAQGNSSAASPALTRKLNISTASKINNQVLSFTFTTAMPDNNYTVLGFGSDQAIGAEGISGGLIGFDQTTTGFKVKYSYAYHATSQPINSFRLVVL